MTIQLRETSVHTQQDLIRSGQLDLGFLTLSEAQMTKDEYVSLWEEEILLAVPQKYPEALLQSARPSRGPPYRVVPLERCRTSLCHDERSFDLRQIQEDIFRQNGLRPQVAEYAFPEFASFRRIDRRGEYRPEKRAHAFQDAGADRANARGCGYRR